MRQILLAALLGSAWMLPISARAEALPELRLPPFTAQALGYTVLSAPDDVLSWYYTLNMASINLDVGVPELDCTLHHLDRGTQIHCIPDSHSFASPFDLRFVTEDHWTVDEETGSQRLEGPTAEQLFTLLRHLSEAEESWNEAYESDVYSSGHYQSEEREDFSLRTSFGSRSDPADAIICTRVNVNEGRNTSCAFLKLP
jgi:hypothetical protein